MEEDLQALVVRAQAGDRTAYGDLYQRCCPRLFNYLAYQLPAHMQVAEELTEGAFELAFQQLNGVARADVAFLSWLYRTARELLAARAPERNNVEPAPQSVARGPLDQAAVAAALQQIPPLLRDVVLLRVLIGLSLADAAVALDTTENDVARLERLGLEALHSALGGPPRSRQG